ncbi:MAG: ABC transporter ATP-binding protein/permease [Tannerellaceae bacterium]|jgi:ABC-type multidrug transport system fused ATPase/permease subunit|nr:ABC transporter ATP-binding protein/permease [Tannerellaceae bacterium]
MKKIHDIKREINVLAFVWKMAKGEHGRILSTIFINILSAILPAGIAYFIKTYIDYNALNFANLLNKDDLALFFSLIISGIFLKMLSQLIMGYTMPNIKKNIEINCIRKFSILPHAYISSSVDNRIIMTLSIESGMISNLVPMVYRSFIKAPVTILGFVGLLLFISPLLTIICFVLISTIMAGVLLFRKTMKRLNRDIYNRIADLHQYFSEWLGGYNVFVTSNATTFMERQLIGVSTESAGLSKQAAKVKAVQTIFIEIITIIVTIVFVWFAARRMAMDEVSDIGGLLLFPAAILFIRGEVLNIIYGYMQLAGTESAARRIIDIIEYPLSRQGKTKSFQGPIETLTLKDVTFRYNETSGTLLDAANVTMHKGEINTLMGRSGAGKSTFINLCMHLCTPDSGTILYNTQDVSTLSEKQLFARVALVEQEPFIFEGTLIENICFDNEPDIALLLKLFDEFDLSHLAKDEKELYKTIGPRNRQLSTGEKQRIAIIRALVKKADIIFFDEVTGNLDAHNASIIIGHIRKIAASTLVVCVSHDLMLIRNSTRLYEIINGKIVCLTK